MHRNTKNKSEKLFGTWEDDDRPENVEGAKALGFYGIHFHSFEQASAKLNKLLL